MKNLGKKIAAGTIVLGIATGAYGEGVTEEGYNPNGIVTSFDYTSPSRDGKPRTFDLLNDGTAKMRDSDYKFVLDEKTGRWFYDVDNSNTRTPGDEGMDLKYNGKFTAVIRDALIQAKDNLALQALQSTELSKRNKGLLETIALMEGRLKASEDNATDYMNQLSILQDKLNEYDKPTIQDEVLQVEPTLKGDYQLPAGEKLPEPKIRDPYQPRLAFNIGGFGGKGFGGLEIGASWEPSAFFGITGSILAGLYADNVLEDITTEPSPTGRYGHGITEEQGKRMLGGALDFSFGTERVKILLGVAMHYTDWIKKNTAEILGADGEIRYSNTEFIPQFQLSGAARVGLEFISKSKIVGSRTMLSVNPKKDEISIVQGLSFRKPQHRK